MNVYCWFYVFCACINHLRIFQFTCVDEGAPSSDEELSGGELDMHEAQPSGEDRELKDKLLRRFGSHIGTLKLEFSKKKKKGKLPKEARQTLLGWWDAHYKWPYPTVCISLSPWGCIYFSFFLNMQVLISDA